MFASWNELDFLSLFKNAGFLKPLPKRKPDRAGGRYLVNMVSAFDIETSRIDLPIEPEGNRIVDTALGLFGVDEGLLGYENFFDEAYLSDLMNEYFQEEEADLAA